MSYIVKAGDSLSIIAQKELGDISLWQYLASINQISSPYILHPGQVIQTDVPTVEAKKTNNTWVWLLVAAAVGGGYYYYYKKKKKKI